MGRIKRVVHTQDHDVPVQTKQRKPSKHELEATVAELERQLTERTAALSRSTADGALLRAELSETQDTLRIERACMQRLVAASVSPEIAQGLTDEFQALGQRLARTGREVRELLRVFGSRPADGPQAAGDPSHAARVADDVADVEDAPASAERATDDEGVHADTARTSSVAADDTDTADAALSDADDAAERAEFISIFQEAIHAVESFPGLCTELNLACNALHEMALDMREKDNEADVECVLGACDSMSTAITDLDDTVYDALKLVKPSESSEDAGTWAEEWIQEELLQELEGLAVCLRECVSVFPPKLLECERLFGSGGSSDLPIAFLRSGMEAIEAARNAVEQWCHRGAANDPDTTDDVNGDHTPLPPLPEEYAEVRILGERIRVVHEWLQPHVLELATAIDEARASQSVEESRRFDDAYAELDAAALSARTVADALAYLVHEAERKVRGWEDAQAPDADALRDHQSQLSGNAAEMLSALVTLSEVFGDTAHAVLLAQVWQGARAYEAVADDLDALTICCARQRRDAQGDTDDERVNTDDMESSDGTDPVDGSVPVSEPEPIIITPLEDGEERMLRELFDAGAASHQATAAVLPAGVATSTALSQRPREHTIAVLDRVVERMRRRILLVTESGLVTALGTVADTLRLEVTDESFRPLGCAAVLRPTCAAINPNYFTEERALLDTLLEQLEHHGAAADNSRVKSIRECVLDDLHAVASMPMTHELREELMTIMTGLGVLSDADFNPALTSTAIAKVRAIAPAHTWQQLGQIIQQLQNCATGTVVDWLRSGAPTPQCPAEPDSLKEMRALRSSCMMDVIAICYRCTSAESRAALNALCGWLELTDCDTFRDQAVDVIESFASDLKVDHVSATDLRKAAKLLRELTQGDAAPATAVPPAPPASTRVLAGVPSAMDLHAATRAVLYTLVFHRNAADVAAAHDALHAAYGAVDHERPREFDARVWAQRIAGILATMPEGASERELVCLVEELSRAADAHDAAAAVDASADAGEQIAVASQEASLIIAADALEASVLEPVTREDDTASDACSDGLGFAASIEV